MAETKEIKKTDEVEDKEFDSAVRSLLQTTFEIHDRLHGSSSARQIWMVWANKFFAAYVKTKNPKGFKSMFLKFYVKNFKYIAVPIFVEKDGEDTQVSDTWLRDTELKEGPGYKPPSKTKTQGKESASSWSPTDLKCRGYVIYFDEKTPKTICVSIPIGHIYQGATKLFKERGEKDPSCRLYPAKILYHFYSILHNILPDADNGRRVIDLNTKALADLIEQLSVNDSSSSDSNGSALSGIGKIMAQVMKAAGISTAGFDGKSIEKSLGSMINDTAINKVGEVVGQVVKSVKESGEGKDGPRGFGDILTGVGNALKSDTVRKIADSVSGETVKQVESLVSSIPSGSSESATSSSSAASASATAPTPTPAPASVPQLPMPTESADPAGQD